MGFRVVGTGLLGVVAVVLFLHGAAHGEEVHDEADRLIRHGVELRKAHDDEGATREFQRAYALDPTPRAAAQLGLAEQALGRWEEAERHVVAALQAPSDPWIARNRSTLESALGTIQSRVGRIEVLGDPVGAEVLVNGRPAGTLPLHDPVRVSAGQVDVELRAPGFVPAQRTLTIVGGQYQRLVLHLAKGATGELPPPQSLGEPPDVTQPIRPPITVVASPPPSDGPSHLRTTLKWGAAGAAGLGAIVGIAATIVHEKGVTSFDSHTNPEPCGDDDGVARHMDGSLAPECQGDLDSYRRARTWAIVGFSSAGAFAVTWLILQLTEGPRPAASSSARASKLPLCVLSLTGLGLSCAARF